MEYITGTQLIGSIGFIYTNKMKEIPMENRSFKKFYDDFIEGRQDKVYIEYHDDGLEPTIEVLNE